MKSFFREDNFEIWLKTLALLNFLVGPGLVLFPQESLSILTFTQTTPSFFIQFIGLVSLAFGLGLIIAAQDTVRHWAILFISLVVNVLFFLLSLKAAWLGEMGINGLLSIGVFLFIGNIVFVYILLDAFNQNTREESAPKQFNDLIKYVRTNDGHTLLELSEKEDVLLIFIRHFGCTFCRETVSEIAKLESALKGKKLKPVFVHMSDPGHADEFFSRYFDHPVVHVSDPSRVLYMSLGLKRGTLMQLFGPRIVVRGFWAGFLKGHGLGGFEGDILQLGGYFVLSKGRIVFEHKTRGAADFFELELLPQK